MPTPIPTVRTVTLTQEGAKFTWTYDNDGTAYSREFDSAHDAQAWLFTPVVVETVGKPEEPA